MHLREGIPISDQLHFQESGGGLWITELPGGSAMNITCIPNS